jgi:hypothetical protein
MRYQKRWHLIRNRWNRPAVRWNWCRNWKGYWTRRK